MARIFFETYGCSLNFSDSEVMKGHLKKEGHSIVDDISLADIIIINSCTVKLPTFNKFRSQLKKYKAYDDKRLIVAGCISQTNLELLEDVSAIGVEQIKNISKVVEETLKGNRIHLVGSSDDERLNLPKIRKNDVVEIVPISKGCLGNCSYCKVKVARGNLLSYDAEKIERQIITALEDGVKEIWLTSQDTATYGQDIGTDIVGLLERVLKIPGDFKIRLGMANPDLVYRYLDGLMDIFEDEKMFRFLHIPLQSGSDKVLRDMNRRYTAKEFEEIITSFRKRFPDMTISTDVICGYPTESEDDFRQTKELIEKTVPDVINISKFYPMDQTPAKKLKQLDTRIIKRRSSEMTGLYHKIALLRNELWKDWQGQVIIDEFGNKGTMIGRNYAYKPVLVKKDNLNIGDKIDVCIKNVTRFDLRAF